ncbi:MAG TPA: DUF4388 domain-containing protein [Acidimicrobiia bacterium]|nr:DUF4388 domain-containing protein [Acidimicrobiia bacterium]
MSLQGTLDTFALADVLELIERCRKSGALEIRDPQSRGVVYFAGGRFSAAEAGELAGPVASAEELEARVIDVCFAMFRVESGLFEFETDRFPPWPVRGGIEVAATVAQVQQLQRDWLAIEAVIPSLDCRPDVVDDLGGEQVVLDRDGFRVLRVVDGELSVRDIARKLGRSVLEVCKDLYDLLEAGAVCVPTAPERTVVDELVLSPDENLEGSSRYSDLPEVHGLVVPSSPEGLEPYAPTQAEARPTEPYEPEGVEPVAVAPDPMALDPMAPDPMAPDPPGSESPAGEPRPATESGPDAGEEEPVEEPVPDRAAMLRLFASLRDD